MKITKLVHSCLLVEMPAPINRTALFDPGAMSTVSVDSLEYLDDIIITHGHYDHFDLGLVKRLVAKFPKVRITAPDEVVATLNTESIPATSADSDGIELFKSPHEYGAPYMPEPPQEIGVHYLGELTDPGDSHSFTETKQILALPIQAPWGSTLEAVRLASELYPKIIIPIHDWHWRDEARQQMYDRLESLFAEQGIRFIKPLNGEPFVVEA
jgi:L-ascorbate metabolism protein UlaG (beta-lactamase superfamily)